MGRRLIWVTLVIAIFVALSGIMVGKDLVLMVETAIALAVATIPEGLPIVATIALARGMWRMARQNALVNRLSAVETLGATNTICTDKTGTLTENRMTVRRIALASSEDVEIEGEGLETEGRFAIKDQAVDPSKNEMLRAALSVGVLCNNASLPAKGRTDPPVGDPMEVALLVAGAKAGLDKDVLMKEASEAREEAFSAESKKMATFHEDDHGYRVAVKGSPEAVLEVCSRFLGRDGERELGENHRDDWLERNDRMASEGLRLLALAAKNVESVTAEPYENLTFLGLVGLLDPPREDVKAALRACRQAGVRVIMITGDQPATARNIARAVGLVETADAEVMSGSAVKSADELSDSERQRILKTQIFALAFTRLQLEVASAVTVSFLTLAFAQLWHVFNMRDRGSGFWRNDITRNAFVWGALELCVGLLLAAVYVPGLALILKVERLDFDGWFLVVAMSLLPWIIGQLLKSRLTETAKSTGVAGGRLRHLKT